MSSRWTGFFIWFLAAASAAFWGIKIFAATRPVPPSAVAPQAAVVAQGPMTRLFGAVAAPDDQPDQPAPESDRFQLVGVIAPRSGSEGAFALVAVDGQPAKAWRVGATIEGDTTLLSVAPRSAQFGPAGGPSAFTLELPEPSAPETGTLPTAVSQPDNAAAQSPGRPPVQQRIGMPLPGAVRGTVPPVSFPTRPGMRPGVIQPGMMPPNLPNNRGQVNGQPPAAEPSPDPQQGGGEKDDE